MKADELMVGDWVIFHDSGYASDGTTWEENRVCQIDSIDEDVRVKWYDESGYKEDWPHVSTVLLSPIPLTSGILKKNGFEDIGDDTYQLEEKPCWFWVDFFRHSYGCEYDTSTYEYEDDEHRLKLYGIPSVHELQQALRLCGIKKEIVL